MSGVDGLDTEARDILRDNDRGGYTVPTAGLYPYQWNWDSAFAAFGFARFDLDRAWREIETLLSGQWENGMVPHILFHGVDDSYFPGPDVWGTDAVLPSSGITQPPLATTIIRRLYQKDPIAGRARLERLFPRLLAWHRWFAAHRTDSHGAITVTHPWESGRDNAPDWDAAMAAIDPVGLASYDRRDIHEVDASMRPTKADYDRYLWLVAFARQRHWDEKRLRAEGRFRMADPATSFIVLRALCDLRALAGMLGRPTIEIDGWIAATRAGVNHLWNAEIGAYDSRNVLTGAFSATLSNASFLCFHAGIDDRRLLPVMERILAGVRYGLPSLDPADPRFDPRRYWRGPTWAMLNMLIGSGLARLGHAGLAERLRRHTQAMIAENGFAEYFDPIDGSPAGGRRFTWTAAVWLGWAAPSASGTRMEI